MAWNIGANDVANAMGTSVGSGALTLVGAVILAGIFEFVGATLVGTHVTETIRKGIIEVSAFRPDGPFFGENGPRILMIGMVAALLAAGLWLQIATTFGLPVSTTHSIIGAVIGFALVAVGVDAVNWGTVGKVVASWVISPALGGAIAATMFVFVTRTVLRNEDPPAAIRRIGPHLIALVAFILILSFVYKALKNVIEDPAWWMVILAAAVTAVVGFLIGKTWLRPKRRERESEDFDYVERVFGRLQIATACFVAFAHGANDVANAVGPVAAVVQIHAFGDLPAKVPVPMWILVLGGAGIVIGLATWGYKVIQTIGRKITELTPSRGFSAEFGAATTVLVASRLGMPVSTTHTLVGAVIGVGLARGIGALDLRVVGRIVNSWLITVPAGAAFSAVFFLALRAWLG
ncbi:MAG: inorganic phosphate transporter [Gemmatimonadota bacterium]